MKIVTYISNCAIHSPSNCLLTSDILFNNLFFCYDWVVLTLKIKHAL